MRQSKCNITIKEKRKEENEYNKLDNNKNIRLRMTNVSDKFF